jgi:hypothetical protein
LYSNPFKPPNKCAITTIYKAVRLPNHRVTNVGSQNPNLANYITPKYNLVSPWNTETPNELKTL